MYTFLLLLDMKISVLIIKDLNIGKEVGLEGAPGISQSREFTEHFSVKSTPIA